MTFISLLLWCFILWRSLVGYCGTRFGSVLPSFITLAIPAICLCNTASVPWCSRSRKVGLVVVVFFLCGTRCYYVGHIAFELEPAKGFLVLT